MICHTEFIKKRLIAEFGIKSPKVKVIRHGVYEVSEQELKIPMEEAKSRLGLDKDDYMILFFGFITGYKGLDLLLEAFNGIASDRRLCLVIAGRVMDIYQAELRDLQRRYDQKNIRFIIRRIDEEELPLLFNAAEITALPYREASQSGVLFMSYAYGVPVVVPDIGGFPYDVMDGKTGLIFRCGDVEDLRLKLEGYVNKIENSGMLSRKKIREFARENYSWTQSGIEFVNFLKA